MGGGLCGVGSLAGGEGGVLRVIEDDALDAEGVGDLTGIQRGAVVFLVGVEAVAVCVQAEGLCHEPVCALGEGAVHFIEGLIPGADEYLTVRELQAVAELAGLRRAYVKGGGGHAGSTEGVPVSEGTEVDVPVKVAADLPREGEQANLAKGGQSFFMTIDAELAGVLAGVHGLGNHADHPHTAQYVVRVRVREEEVVNSGEGDTGLFQTGEDFIAAAGVREQHLFSAAEGKAGVVAARDGGVARAQHDEFRVHVKMGG